MNGSVHSSGVAISDDRNIHIHGIFNGWPGTYWLEQTLGHIATPDKLMYYCNLNGNTQTRTVATIRALNWRNKHNIQ